MSMRAVLERWTTQRVAVAALAGVVACVAGLVWRQHRLGGLKLLDSRGWYTPSEAAADLLENLTFATALSHAGALVTYLRSSSPFNAASCALFVLVWRPRSSGAASSACPR